MGTSISISDPKACRRLLSEARVAAPRPCPASRMGLRLAESPDNKLYKEQSVALHRLLSRADFIGRIRPSLHTTRDYWLPTAGQPVYLYREIVRSIANALSVIDYYFGFKCEPAGNLFCSDYYWSWFETFGKYATDPSICEAKEEIFLERSISIGRLLVSTNASPSVTFGRVTQMFFDERSVPVPSSLRDIEYLEAQYPRKMAEVYFEVAARLVRGTDSIAYATALCIERLFHDSSSRDEIMRCTLFPRSDDDSESRRILEHLVVETLRFNPPIAKVGRSVVAAKPNSLGVNPGDHFYFDIQHFNRSPDCGGPAFRDSSEMPVYEEELTARNVHLETGATFGSYTYQMCPAALFSVRFIVAYLQILHSELLWRSRSSRAEFEQRVMDNSRVEAWGTFSKV